MNKKKTFDPIWENMITNIRVANMEMLVDDQRRTTTVFGVLFAVFVLLIGGLFTHEIATLQRKVAQLQEESLQIQCQHDADKIGAGYSFIAKGAQSECNLLYID